MDLVGIKIIVNTQRMSQTILITGASSGIGKATALKFQAEGWNVIATMRRPENEQELSQLDKVVVERLDVLDVASIDQAVQKGIERFGGIDALARGLLAADAILEDGTYEAFLADRYNGWTDSFGDWILKEASLEESAAKVECGGSEPSPRSGRQEMLENLLNRFV